MIDAFEKVLPIILLFGLGYLLKIICAVKEKDADLLLNLVFNIALPSLIILSVSKVSLSFDLIYLPIMPFFVVLITYFAAKLFSGWLNLPKATLGVFLIGSMIFNTNFVLPFIVAVYGEAGLARWSLFNFGSSLMIFSFVYYIAHKHSKEYKGVNSLLKQLFLSPPLWALIIGIFLNLAGLGIPAVAGETLKLLADLTIPLVMIALGILFVPQIAGLRSLLPVIFLRMGGGFILGVILARVFGMEGLTRAVAIITSASPVGYLTLIFSTTENLDKKFAASLLSFSIFLGIIFTPLLILFLNCF